MIKKLKYLHSPGGSCACVAWSGILRNMGFDITEADVFGIGSGIYYGYFAIGNSKEFNISLISPSIINDLITNIGLSVKQCLISNDEYALEFIINSIDNNNPVPLQLNPGAFESLRRRVDQDYIKHIPAHWIVVTGYNDEKKIMYISDNRQFNSIEIPFDEFIKARNSGEGEQNPRNSTYYIPSIEKVNSMKEIMYLSLRKAVSNYIDVQKILAVYIGSYGMEKTIRQVLIWHKILKEEQLVELLQRIQMSITGAGGVKGGYRLLFASYLQHACEVLRKNELSKCAQLFRQSSDYWNKFIINISETKEDVKCMEHWNNFSLILSDIKRIEEEGFNSIRKIIS